jgi:hypothetical protein
VFYVPLLTAGACVQHDKAETMRRLLARIDVCLPALQATRKPATEDAFAGVEAEFQLKFPPGALTNC